MRAFIALDLSDAFRDECADLARQLAAWMDARFVPRENYHVTLAFLGEVGEAEAEAAVCAVDALAEGPLPRIAAEGLGTFGRPSNATLWLGLRRGEELMALAVGLRGELGARGLAYDEKAFLPHVTLARHANVAAARSLPGLVFPEGDCAAGITLYKSELGPEGARYKALYTR